jgi:predicted Zn-dependent protease
MSIRGACGVVFAAAVLTLGSLPGRERAVFAAPEGLDRGERALMLEAQVAAHPADSLSRTSLAKVYLDAGSPGLAWRTLSTAPAAQQDDPALQHMAARVLIEQGQAKDALALERRVLATCGNDPAGTAPGCDAWLIISATRRADILDELVRQGVDDAVAHPEASLVAYHNATHEARLAVAE